MKRATNFLQRWSLAIVALIFVVGCQSPSYRDDSATSVLKLERSLRSHEPAAIPPSSVVPLADRLTTPAELRIGSWNIEHLGSPAKRSGPAKNVKQRAEDLADYIAFSEVDVLGLIEIYGDSTGSSANRILNAAFETLDKDRGAKWKYALFGKGRQQLIGVAWNTAKVSRVGSIQRIEFPSGSPTRGPQGNIIWHRHPHVVKFAAHGQQQTDFAVIVLHMKADYEGDFADHRKVEAELLSEVFPELRDRVDRDLILIGDANAKGHAESSVQQFVRSGFKDLNRQDAKTHWQFGALDRALVPTDQPEFSDSKLVVLREQYWATQNLTQEDFKRKYSDHFLIWMTLKVLRDDD